MFADYLEIIVKLISHPLARSYSIYLVDSDGMQGRDLQGVRAIIHREDGVFSLALLPFKKKTRKKNPFFGTLFEMCYFSTAEVVYETAVVKGCWGG